MSTPQFPHAALLIDFDNVTMGIRSDLSKELKNLLSSDFIKGKVAVQRAYADWRRYPQYIVPLAESSVDLIFAPAYGSSKKNATDIRLAIDALELVFTRPEIGTFILLSGDSDFSSLVLKLKEYGKYVVGVGIRESASDLLVQNCDEYYSYSALTGLTRAGDEAAATAEDPWELVEQAIKQMAESNDVMRSDRLKQVILEMDPNFDEKALGFQKFNRFMQEAAGRGLVSLRKLENGQYEVGLPGVLGDIPVQTDEDTQQHGNGRRRSRRGRGGRDRGEREYRERAPADEVRPETTPASAEVEAPAATAASPAATQITVPVAVSPLAAAAPFAPAAPPMRGARPERAERPDRGEPSAASASPASTASVPVAASAPVVPAAEARTAMEPARGGRQAAREDPLRVAYGLLRRAVADVGGRAGEVARDSDIKRRMLELQEGWDEAALGFSKFSRFLRQAHDAEVINLRKLDNGGYEASLAAGGESVVPAGDASAERGKARGRRDRGRGARQPELDLVGERGRAAGAGAPVAAGATLVTQPVRPAAAATPPEATAPAPATVAGGTQTGGGQGIGMRRGSRGRAPGAMPPPLLEGQAIPSGRLSPAAAPAAAGGAPVQAVAAPARQERAVEPAAVERPEGMSGRTRSRGGRTKAAAAPQTVAKPEAKVPPAPVAEPAAEVAGGGARGRRKAAPAEASLTPEPAAALPGLESLGLPTALDEVVSYLQSYEGVGPKSIQHLVDAFGARVFEALRSEPDRVREIVGGARGERLLAAWQADYQRRVKARAKKGGGRPATRGRRGGRKRTAKGA